MRMNSPIAVGLAAMLCGCPVITKDVVASKDAANQPYLRR
jgi:hypothetical protein